MLLLNTYENETEAEAYLLKIKGKKRLASERDDNVVIYNLFGEATWSNLYVLDLFHLKELELAMKMNEEHIDIQKIKLSIEMAARIFSLPIPKHWDVFLQKETLSY